MDGFVYDHILHSPGWRVAVKTLSTEPIGFCLDLVGSTRGMIVAAFDYSLSAGRALPFGRKGVYGTNDNIMLHAQRSSEAHWLP